MDRPELEQRSAAFARGVFMLCKELRSRPGGTVIAAQLQKAASSVAANYRASARSRSHDEFIAKIGVVNEEADESVFWLEHIRDTDLLGEQVVRPLYNEARQLRAIFAASYATARRNPRAKKPVPRANVETN